MTSGHIVALSKTWSKYKDDIIRRVCEQTLGLGLGQSKDIVVVIISLQRTKG